MPKKARTVSVSSAASSIGSSAMPGVIGGPPRRLRYPVAVQCAAGAFRCSTWLVLPRGSTLQPRSHGATASAGCVGRMCKQHGGNAQLLDTYLKTAGRRAAAFSAASAASAAAAGLATPRRRGALVGAGLDGMLTPPPTPPPPLATPHRECRFYRRGGVFKGRE